MTSSSMRSVLIVEDEAPLRLALRVHFLRHGWDVTLASGVREAKTALCFRSFDLIVSDLRMLDGDGFEVLSAVRTQSPSTAVLFLTANASVPEAVQAVREGAVDYLVKPVAFDILLGVAERALKLTKDVRPALNHRNVDGLTPTPSLETRPCPTRTDDGPLSMSDLERSHLIQTLERVGGNRTHAAQVLGISVRTLRNKVRQYDLPPRRYA